MRFDLAKSVPIISQLHLPKKRFFFAPMHFHYTPENEQDNGKPSFLIGDASPNGCFSIVMLVFGGVCLCLSHKNRCCFEMFQKLHP